MTTTEIVAGAGGIVYGYNSTYSVARSTAYSVLWGGTNLSLGQHRNGSNRMCFRYFHRFDTSVIGAGQTVTQANLRFAASADSSTTDFDVQIVKCDWSSYDPINSGNMDSAYDLALSDAADNSIWRNTSGISANTAYTSGNLDTSWVNPEGYTYYAIRSSRDFNADDPSTAEYITMYGFLAAEAYRPTLIVTHVEGGGGSSTPIHLIRTGMQPGMRIGL